MHMNIIYENNIYYKKIIVVNLFCSVNSNSNTSQPIVLINSISIWWLINIKLNYLMKKIYIKSYLLKYISIKYYLINKPRIQNLNRKKNGTKVIKTIGRNHRFVKKHKS